MGFVTLTDGMLKASTLTHDMSLFIEVLRGHYISELTPEESERLKKYVSMLEEIRDGTGNVAKAYTRLTSTDY